MKNDWHSFKNRRRLVVVIIVLVAFQSIKRKKRINNKMFAVYKSFLSYKLFTATKFYFYFLLLLKVFNNSN